MQGNHRGEGQSTKDLALDMNGRLEATRNAAVAAPIAGAAIAAAATGLGEARLELGLGALLLGCLAALRRPRRAADGHRPEEHRRALEIVESHGADSLAPFALRDDKSLHFAAGGFLAYRVLGETAVVSGDPIGPSGSAGPVLASFLRLAERHRWRVALTAASERHLDEYRSLGLRAMRIGEEAVVDPRSFSLEGRAIRKVRQSVNRVARRGWTVEVVEGRGLTGPLVAELVALEAEWRSRQKRLVGFAMTLGRPLDPADDRDGTYVLGRDPDGRLRTFLRFASFEQGLSLDLMRRSGEEPNGVTEALVVATIEHARAMGLARVSLNFAGFAHVMAADAELGPGRRLLRLALRALHGRFQLERLIRFNAKFMPAWQPRYLVYGSLARLPLAGLRVLQAEGYIRGPRAPAMRNRWQPRPLGDAVLAPPPAAVRRRPRLSFGWAGATMLLVLSFALPGAQPAASGGGGAQDVPVAARQTSRDSILTAAAPATVRALDITTDGVPASRVPAVSRPPSHEGRIG